MMNDAHASRTAKAGADALFLLDHVAAAAAA